eukprot:8226049-Pyramimonas_sp.AAC.2
MPQSGVRRVPNGRNAEEMMPRACLPSTESIGYNTRTGPWSDVNGRTDRQLDIIDGLSIVRHMFEDECVTCLKMSASHV